MSSSAESDEVVEVGRIARPHGVRGELKVRLHWSGSDVLTQVPAVLVSPADGPGRIYEISSARRADQSILLKLAGVDDRDAADALRGAGLSVPRSALPPLEDGEYYLRDLIGARVFTPEGELGQVVEVRIFPTADAIVIECPDGRRVEQPLLDHWVQEVDLAERRIVLSSRDGLIE